MIGQNGTEEVEDLNNEEDRKVAAAPSQSVEDFEVPVQVSTQEGRKVKPYCHTTRKRNRGDRDRDEQQKMPTNPMEVIVTLTPTYLLDEDEHVPLKHEEMNGDEEKVKKNTCREMESFVWRTRNVKNAPKLFNKV